MQVTLEKGRCFEHKQAVCRDLKMYDLGWELTVYRNLNLHRFNSKANQTNDIQNHSLCAQSMN